MKNSPGNRKTLEKDYQKIYGKKTIELSDLWEFPET